MDVMVFMDLLVLKVSKDLKEHKDNKDQPVLPD